MATFNGKTAGLRPQAGLPMICAGLALLCGCSGELADAAVGEPASEDEPAAGDAETPAATPTTGTDGQSDASDPPELNPPEDAEVEANAANEADQASNATATSSQPPNETPVDSIGELEQPLPTACGRELPARFVSLCSACHTQSGAANERYPDLFTFDGSAEDFMGRVRAGGDGMIPFSESLIADEELRAAFDYFTASERASGTTVTGIAPLFVEADAQNPAIVFQRIDGVLVTRAAGRVRQRHELEGTFNPYGAHYFEDRSHGFIIEDHTPVGESLIRVYYLPAGTPTEGTNFRAWKIYGDGNVFHSNMGMSSGEMPPLDTGTFDLSADYASSIAPFSAVQVQEVTRNPRTGAPIEAGESFEFEFGVFLEEGAVRTGSRTSYYSDTFRYQVGEGGLSAENLDPSGQLGPVLQARQGGDGTNVWLYEDAEFAFGQMALNIQHENTQPFLRGRRLFHTDFETGAHSEGGNPDFTEQAGKLGPRFVARSCLSCHIHNGPGATVDEFDERTSMAFKLYDSDELGVQLQQQEGNARLTDWESEVVILADGEEVELRRPRIEVVDASGAPLNHSARLARKLIGLGLLEAIDESTLLSRTDPMDCDEDGISGRAAFVEHPESGVLMLGRFGWKAEKISVRHQVLEALNEDMGVGSAMFPDSEGRIEVDETETAELVAYMRLLSVPAQRGTDEPMAIEGEALFRTTGCAQCHVTDVITGSHHPFAELRDQSIKPYTDLLLHDMGPALADESGVPEGHDDRDAPSASEWRTPPLWGLGLHETVNGHTGLLHDGRAAGVLEAVLWHGGEASAAREAFTQLSRQQRDALVAFVESL